MVHLGKPTMLNGDTKKIQVRERRQWGSERVDTVESNGTQIIVRVNLNEGTARSSPRVGTLLDPYQVGSNMDSDRQTAQYVNSEIIPPNKLSFSGYMRHIFSRIAWMIFRRRSQ